MNANSSDARGPHRGRLASRRTLGYAAHVLHPQDPCCGASGSPSCADEDKGSQECRATASRP